MEEKTFFEHYRICTDDDGSSHEVSRAGAAINYKAIDTRSDESVTLQLIPVAMVDLDQRQEFEERARAVQKLDHVNIARVNAVGVEHEHVGLVSEYVEGETAEAWVAAHGPMPADAVLRVGIQVVRALAAAAFDGLTHRAIQPSNLMIVRGQAADDGWPFVKLVNFGLAGLEIYSNGAATRELASTAAPQFASPEQLLNRPIDFRSEIYSLGATMCFLLTGAVPLAVSGMRARLRARRLPELRRAPKALRNLLAHMLQENPESRPQDPVAFEAEIRECLTKVERRQAFGRKLGISLAVVTPRKPKTIRGPISPFAQVFRGALAIAALVLTAVVLGAFLLPEDAIPIWRNRTASNKIGIPVGVPEASPAAIATNNPTPVTQTTEAPVAANPTVTNPTAAAAIPNSSPENEQAVSNASPAASVPANIDAPVAANQQAASPAEGPDTGLSASQNSQPETETSAPATVEPQPSIAQSSSSGQTNSETAKSTRTSTSKRARVSPNDYGPSSGSLRARFVGMTPDGRIILRLPSGRTVFVRPRPEDDVPAVRRHRRAVEWSPPPFQPFDPYRD